MSAFSILQLVCVESKNTLEQLYETRNKERYVGVGRSQLIAVRAQLFEQSKYSGLVTRSDIISTGRRRDHNVV